MEALGYMEEGFSLKDNGTFISHRVKAKEIEI